MDLKDPKTKINPAATGFAMRGVPTKIVIDAGGNIRFHSIGHRAHEDVFWGEMDAMINIAKAGEPPVIRQTSIFANQNHNTDFL